MKMTEPSNATANCEAVLRAEHAYNSEHQIWPSQNKIIDRMLERRLELDAAYAELWDKALASSHYFAVFVDRLLAVATVWTPERLSEARDHRREMAALNADVALAAGKLAKLLAQREALNNAGHFWTDIHSHPIRLIEGAAASHHEFNSYVRKDLHRLRGQFDLRYWPSLAECIAEIARDAVAAQTKPTNDLTAVGTSGKRPSRADFLKAFYVVLEECKDGGPGSLPSDFDLSDQTVASLMNVVLDLGPDDLVDATYVKGFRQRDRAAQQKTAPQGDAV